MFLYLDWFVPKDLGTARLAWVDRRPNLGSVATVALEIMGPMPGTVWALGLVALLCAGTGGSYVPVIPCAKGGRGTAGPSH